MHFNGPHEILIKQFEGVACTAALGRPFVFLLFLTPDRTAPQPCLSPSLRRIVCLRELPLLLLFFFLFCFDSSWLPCSCSFFLPLPHDFPSLS